MSIAISIFDLVCSLFAPNLIFSANGINAFTPFFSTLFLLLPIGYSTFVFGVTAYNALINRKNGLGHYYLVLSFYPLLMTGFGFIEVMLSTALPLYSYAVTFYFTFNFLYQLNFFIKEATIDSLTGLRNRENLKEYIDDIWKEGVSDQYYLFMIDMNGLKSVNDVYGHVEGEMLSGLSARPWTTSCRLAMTGSSAATEVTNFWQSSRLLTTSRPTSRSG